MMCLGKIAVVTKHLKRRGEVVATNPLVGLRCASQLVCAAMLRAVIVDVIEAKKSQIIQTATRAFPAISHKNFAASFLMVAYADFLFFFRILFPPHHIAGIKPLANLVVVSDVICAVAFLLSSQPLCGIKFFTHVGMLP